MFTWNTTTCAWDTSGSQAAAPTGLSACESATFDAGTCSWIVSSTGNEVVVNMYNQFSGISWAQGAGEAYLVVSDGTTSYTLNKSATTSSFAHTLCLTDDCWTITAVFVDCACNTREIKSNSHIMEA